MAYFDEMTLNELIRPEGHACECGKTHDTGLRFVRIGQGAVETVPEALAFLGAKKPFLVADHNTWQAAGEKVAEILKSHDIPFSSYVFPASRGHIEPDEAAVGSIAMAFDPSCDILLAVGSGVVNDCCRVMAHAAGNMHMVVGTAPSMDGYASNSSSMIVDRIKTSVYARCPQAIIADIDIMKEAPMELIRAGIGVETTAVFHETAEKDTVLAYAYDPDRHTVVLTVSLGPKIATGLEVERMPDETEYFRGDSFSPEGLVLTVLYGEHREPAEEDFTFTPGRFDAAGEQTVTVSCAGQTAEIPVVVHDVVCVGIEVCRLPLKTTYRVGDPLETAGMAVARVYNNGEREIAAEEMVCTPVVLTRPGEQQITVTCAGMKTFFDITVEEAN